jgi:uncharacterized protein (DUF362 family)
MNRSTVAVVRCSPTTVLQDVDRLLDLAGVGQSLDLSRPTILKDNLSWHMPFLSANTTPWQLEGTYLALRRRGFSDLSAVHNDTVVTDPVRGGRANRLTAVYQKYEIPELYNFRAADMRWVTFRPRSRMRVLNRIYPEGIRLPDYFFSRNIVHLPTVKCHIYTTTTGAMKNAFGGLLGTRRHYTHTHIHETLVDLLAIQKEIHSGIFAVMDGTLCGNGPGPRTMVPEQRDLMLASGDSVAIDAVAAKLMGFDPMGIDYIRLAHEDGLGVGRPDQIEVVGEDISGLDFGFRVGDNLASRIGDLLWFSPARKLQRLFFHTPLVYLFVFGSFLFHDYLWWPLVGRGRMQRVAETDWGRLFGQYPVEWEAGTEPSRAAGGEAARTTR